MKQKNMDKEIILEDREFMMERLELVMERIVGIAEEHAGTVPSRFQSYFCRVADFLQTEYDFWKQMNEAYAGGKGGSLYENAVKALYTDTLESNYATGFLNPSYACEVMGEEYGRILCALYAKLLQNVRYVFEGDAQYLCLFAELFVEVFNEMEGEEAASAKELEDILYSFMHDNLELFQGKAIRRLILPDNALRQSIVMDSDFSNPAYLFRYGLYVGEDELRVSSFLQSLEEEQIQAMADTFTEGYRIGFATTGKDISLKSVAEIRYPLGFERMVRAAVRNFEKIGMKSVLSPFSISENKQFVYDHREDRGLWLTKAYVERGLEVSRLTWEQYKKEAPQYGGPAVIEVFGTKPFTPVQKKEAVRYSKKQQELSVYETSEAAQLRNRAIHGEERSFTIIAYPVPSIGEQFEEIFAETVKINTLDYVLYRDMQQKLIDVLDTAEFVHVVGCKGNKTDLFIKIYPLQDPAKETAFENCVADVNIPVGEVFTTPVLKGTKGKLFVSKVYLNELQYRDLELDFEDGKIVAYTCSNFENEEENRKYIEDNVLFHHSFLPMGEFAIGTNTTAYRMARVYDIADKLPILIAEKTGPHFAVGDTCYTYEEDMLTYNPDGKAIVARDNEISLLRKEDISKAYFNCHTDITIPYDELGRMEVIRTDGTKENIIVDGRFVVPGTEALNIPLDELKGE